MYAIKLIQVKMKGKISLKITIVFYLCYCIPLLKSEND